MDLIEQRTRAMNGSRTARKLEATCGNGSSSWLNRNREPTEHIKSEESLDEAGRSGDNDKSRQTCGGFHVLTFAMGWRRGKLHASVTYLAAAPSTSCSALATAFSRKRDMRAARDAVRVFAAVAMCCLRRRSRLVNIHKDA
eukprot:6128103-Pleurochrysis_carterae.AAC.3